MTAGGAQRTHRLFLILKRGKKRGEEKSAPCIKWSSREEKKRERIAYGPRLLLPRKGGEERRRPAAAGGRKKCACAEIHLPGERGWSIGNSATTKGEGRSSAAKHNLNYPAERGGGREPLLDEKKPLFRQGSGGRYSHADPEEKKKRGVVLISRW